MPPQMTNRTCRTVYANNCIGELSKKRRPIDLYVSKVKKKKGLLIFTMYGAYFNNKMIVHLSLSCNFHNYTSEEASARRFIYERESCG